MLHRHLFVILAGALFVAGCSESDEKQSRDKTDGATSATSATSARSGVEGKWLMIASMLDRPVEIRLAIVEIEKGKNGERQAAVIHSSDKFFPNAKIKSSKFADGSINLLFELVSNEDEPGGELNVQALLDGDVIRGSAETNNGRQPVRLIRTTQNHVTATEPDSTDGADTFVAAMQGNVIIESLQQFVKEHSDSPTALTAYLQMIGLCKRENQKLAVAQQFASDFFKTARRWGPSMEQVMRIQAATVLAQQHFLPKLVLEILEPLEKSPPEEGEDEVNSLASRVEYIKALAQIFSDDKQLQYSGAETLTKLNIKHPFVHQHRTTLAKYNDRAGNADLALRLYAELAVLPEGEQSLAVGSAHEKEGERESATEAATRLWTEKHGNTDGLPEFLEHVYAESIDKVTTAAKPPVTAGTRVSLIEVFTGSACPPCVSADVATTGLEATYPKSSLIVLRYHEHVGLPDPLANADTETRFAYYEGTGTPTVILNGKLVPRIAGPLFLSQMMYDQLRKEVDPAIAADSEIKIELSALGKDGQLSLNARVTGGKDLPSGLRLRLVLAEDSIDFVARNGIREHEMVVRAMPGGPAGILQKEGRLDFTESISLAQLKQDQIKYLETIEQEFMRRLESPFMDPRQRAQMPRELLPIRPLDYRQLHFVAFVQDDITKQILQAAAIPVSGTLVDSSPMPKKQSKPPEPAKDSETGPVEAPFPPAAGQTGDGSAKGRGSDKSGPKLIDPNER